MPGGAPRSPLDRLQNVTVELREKRKIDPVKLAAAGIVVAAALLALSLTYWYFYQYTPGRKHHDRWVSASTPVRVVLKPAEIQRYLSKMAPLGTRLVSTVPRLQSTQHGPIHVDWIHVLPYEFSFLLHGGGTTEQKTTLFVNHHPDGPHFAEILNTSGFFRDFRMVIWDSPRLQPKEEGVFLASGRLPVSNRTRKMLQSLWPDPVSPPPPPLEGEHLLEVDGDNTNGALMLLHQAAWTAYGAWGGGKLHNALNQVWPSVRRAELIGDLSGQNELTFDLTVLWVGDRRETAEEALGLLQEAIACHMHGRFGFAFTGTTAWVNSFTLEGRYYLRGFEPKLRRALGNT